LGQRFFGAELRQAEVENLGIAAWGDENIGGLDVAMNDPGVVGRSQRIGDPDSEREQRFHLQWLAGDALFQGGALQILHDDEGAAVLFTDVINRADVRVIQGRRSLGLAPESAQGFGIAGEVIGQKLESDESLEPAVFGLIDHPHAAVSQFLDDPVMGDIPANERIDAFLRVMALVASQCACCHIYRGIRQEPCCVPL